MSTTTLPLCPPCVRCEDDVAGPDGYCAGCRPERTLERVLLGRRADVAGHIERARSEVWAALMICRNPAARAALQEVSEALCDAAICNMEARQ